jgi:hypothetical protein
VVRQRKKTSAEPIAEATKNQVTVNENEPCVTEPKNILSYDEAYHQNFQKAWREFIADARYRLACDTDSALSDDAKNRQSWYVFNYGNWNYPKRDYEEHFAAIVVGTTRSDPNRFGLVIFSPPKGGKNNYEINWLYKDRDLSKASVGMASGGGYVTNNTDVDEKSCFFRWNRSKRVFECP